MVTLINKFTVSGNAEDFERLWKASSEFMLDQPGFISFRLVRSLADRSVYFNVAEWADAESHIRVMRGPGFQTHLAELATVARAEPSLCEVVLSHQAS